MYGKIKRYKSISIADFFFEEQETDVCHPLAYFFSLTRKHFIIIIIFIYLKMCVYKLISQQI